ncbi:hypothetical protein [Winogradskyella wichelsiae]|uniref:hypothetical protein n=1 Tax=Winogradskyella wichelsiae TaxID=2697007 RepID=UPI0015C94450|nr:hypothetical protein [Winogradskyella wichelsiae]
MDGNFLNGYKVVNGILTSEYFENNYQNRNGELTVTTNSNPDCPDCPFSVCSYCDALDEVVIIAGGGNSASPINYVVLHNIFDFDGGGNSWGSGGGGSSGSSGTSPSTSDPCDKINSLGTNTDFKNKMTDLKNSTGLNYEKGYYIGLNGENSFTPINGNANQPYIDINPSSPISGFMHSHNTEGDSMFSPDDIRALYQLYDNNLMQNSSTFTFSVVTNQGTSYTIVIDDIAAFNNFGIANFNNQANFVNFSNTYTIDFFDAVSSGYDFITAREIAMLKALGNSGLILTKATSNFDDWKKLSSSRTNGIINGDCN